MSYIAGRRVYDCNQTKMMSEAYQLACERLRLGPNDQFAAKELARAILTLTASGRTRPEKLAQEAATLFRSRRRPEARRTSRVLEGSRLSGRVRTVERPTDGPSAWVGPRP